MKYLLALLVFLSLPTVALAGGSIPWEAVHKEILKQDPELIAFVDKTFDVAPNGGAMRPLIGEHAGERFAPYDFLAKPKGAKGDYIFNLTFDVADTKSHRWSILVIIKK